MFKKVFFVFVGLVFLGVSLWSVSAAAQCDTLPPDSIPKYLNELVIPPSMPAKFKSKFFDYYEIAVRQFQQQILPAKDKNGNPLFDPTTVWSYGPAGESTGDNEGLHAAAGGHYFYPAFTIEAKNGQPVRVKWVNELKHGDGTFRPHLLPVDQTLHWANPPGGEMGRDMRPQPTDPWFSTGPYTGPVPMVSHLHGTVGVGDESDGYAEAWFLPDAKNIPGDYAEEGTWYDFFKVKAFLKFWQPWEKGSAVFQYPNEQRASTLWYHDHTLGMTRANVYAGPAGFYLLRGGPDDRNLKFNPPSETLGVGVNPKDIITEIPIAIQDRSFKPDGSLFFPPSRACFGDVPPEGPFIPATDISPIWNPEFFGNTMVTNGQTWPYLNVEQRRYRFRLLNGCNARFLILKFNHPDVKVWQIGNEGGFLPEPLDVSTFPAPYKNRILLGPAERADLIVDFSEVPVGTRFKLRNFGPDEPFGGGAPVDTCRPEIDMVCFAPADPATTGQVMEFRVAAVTGKDNTKRPEHLQLPNIKNLVGGAKRPLALLEEMTMVPDLEAPVAALLGIMSGGTPTPKMWMEGITENPRVGETEVWELYNFTGDAHPIHIHEVHFQVLNRQSLVTNDAGDVIIPATPTGPRRAPEVWEKGAFKDTVIAYPGEVTRVRAKFDKPGLFVWHCHIVDHEDNEMMRPYFIGGNLLKFPYDSYIKSRGRNLF